MNTDEVWEILTQDIKLPNVFGCDKIIDDKNGLTIIFVCEEEKTVKVIFDKIVYSFRKSIDSVFTRTIFYLQQNYEPSFYEDEWIYEVKNSRYLKWLEEESADVYKKDRVRHFVFGTYNEFIEVLCSFSPKIIIED